MAEGNITLDLLQTQNKQLTQERLDCTQFQHCWLVLLPGICIFECIYSQIYKYVCTYAKNEGLDCDIVIPPKKTLWQINNLLGEWKSQKCNFFHSHEWRGVHRPFPISNEGDRYFHIFLFTVMETGVEAKFFPQATSFLYARPCIAIHHTSWFISPKLLPSSIFSRTLQKTHS